MYLKAAFKAVFFIFVFMKNSNSIGFFDSGIGGTTVWKEVNKLLPNENTIYLADSKNAPYGNKSKDEIIALSEKNVEFLLEQNSKIIVVACNTATTNAIGYLRTKYKIPFIGLEPAIKPAALASKTNKIAVLATKGTLESDFFLNSINAYQQTQIFTQIGYGLVDLIESGNTNSKTTFDLLNEYLSPLVAEGIDYLVLGCTHYPYLIPIIKKIIPKSIKIIDSGEAVAKQTKLILENFKLLNTSTIVPTNKFYINVDSSVLRSFLEIDYSIYEHDF